MFDDVTKTITIKRGDGFDWTINFSTGDSALDMTNCKFWFTVRKTIVSNTVKSDSDALISKEFEGNSEGAYTLSLSGTDTDIPNGNYYYDIQYQNASGKNSSSTTYKFVVTPDVTRSR